MFDRVIAAMCISSPHVSSCDICRTLWDTVRAISVKGFHVTVSCGSGTIGDRGHCLLQLERHLRDILESPIEVFLEPSADANKLRQRLRGVTVE